MNRTWIGYAVGAGFVVLGFYFGLFALAPCEAQGCFLWSNYLVSWTVSSLLSLGSIVLGFGVLTASLLMGRRSQTTTKVGTAN